MAKNKFFFIKEIEKTGVPFKVRDNNIAVLCPYHNDRKPSLNVNINKTKTGMGVFHCWSCGAKGNWNRLANKLGMALLKGAIYEDTPFEGLIPKMPVLEKVILPPDTSPWKGSWRGLTENFLSQFNPKEYYDPVTECTRILFPVTINKKLIGYTSVIIPGIDTKIKSLNSEGNWVKDSLFPYDLIKGDRVVLVEGVYDALRLISYNIPAVSIMGSKWESGRRSKLITKNITKLVLCFDGDLAGRTVTEAVTRNTKGYMKVKDFGLPVSDAKLDPGNIPLNLITEVSRQLKRL